MPGPSHGKTVRLTGRSGRSVCRAGFAWIIYRLPPEHRDPGEGVTHANQVIPYRSPRFHAPLSSPGLPPAWGARSVTASARARSLRMSRRVSSGEPAISTPATVMLPGLPHPAARRRDPRQQKPAKVTQPTPPRRPRASFELAEPRRSPQSLFLFQSSGDAPCS